MGMTEAERKRAGLRRGEIELVLHLTPNSEAIQRHWDEYQALSEFDHEAEGDSEVACLIREMASALELDGLASGIKRVKTNAMHGHWCLVEGQTKSTEPTPTTEHRGSRA